MMRRGTILIALVTSACLIDGVPLPDQTDDRGEDNPTPATGFAANVTLFATRSSGVTLVFGVPGTVDAGATVVAASARQQARTVADTDGSFNVPLAGELAPTIEVSILAAGKLVDTASIATPESSDLLVPDGTATAGNDPPTHASVGASRADDARTNIDFPAGAFAPNVVVAIANLDQGSTETSRAAADGSLLAQVKAARGDTLYVVALTNTGASSPYIITAP